MDNKLKNGIIVLDIIILLVMVCGATFAWFSYTNISDVSPVVDTKTATTEFILFDVGKNIELSVNNLNFREDMDNIASTTYASASLRLSDGQTKRTHYYNIYLILNENNFIYSTSSKTPEIILTVLDSDNKPLTEIKGLDYVTVGEGKNKVSGFDITTKVGEFPIVEKEKIETTSYVEHNWKIKVTFVNLNESQDRNLDKYLNGIIKVEKASGYERIN